MVICHFCLCRIYFLFFWNNKLIFIWRTFHHSWKYSWFCSKGWPQLQLKMLSHDTALPNQFLYPQVSLIGSYVDMWPELINESCLHTSAGALRKEVYLFMRSAKLSSLTSWITRDNLLEFFNFQFVHRNGRSLLHKITEGLYNAY
jgi:hypothetical protein